MVRIEWIFYCITFLYMINEGASLICYSCSASVGHNAACENITEHLSDISHEDCNYNNAVCAKYERTYGSDTLIYRGCKNAEICFALAKKFNSPQNQILDCQTCNDGDFCNSAPTKFSWNFLMTYSIIPVVLGFLLRR